MWFFFQLRQEYKKSDFKQYWMPDENCKECYECGEKFNTFRRRHHCRLCGQIFCYRCCYLEIPGKIMGYAGKEKWTKKFLNKWQTSLFVGDKINIVLQWNPVNTDKPKNLSSYKANQLGVLYTVSMATKDLNLELWGKNLATVRGWTWTLSFWVIIPAR